MTEIKRYYADGDGCLQEGTTGNICRWSDVEALLKECDEVRAKALAAVWLLVQEGVNLTDNLATLHEEARNVLLGKDKQTIAKLQDDLRYAQEVYQHAVRPPRTGVNAVYGFKPDVGGEIRHALMISGVKYAPNGGLEIEVQLP